MSLSLLALWPQTLANHTELGDLPVSIAVREDGSLFTVSRFGDPVWDFYPYILQENLTQSSKMIRWDFKLPQGGRFTDSEHADLLLSAKSFIWSLFLDPVEGRKRPGMLTLKHKTASVRYLIYWMLKCGFKQFREIENHTLDYAKVARFRANGEGLLSPGTIAQFLGIVEDIYHQREKLNDALSKHPWPHESSVSLAGLKTWKNHRASTTECISEDVLNKLTKISLDYIQNRAPKILEVLENTINTDIKPKNKNRSYDYISLTIKSKSKNCSVKLSNELYTLRTSCYIIINLFSGMRNSEVLSLDTDCITHKSTEDGFGSLTFLHGTTYKTGHKKKTWLVPPVVEEAVIVLTRLMHSVHGRMEAEEQGLKRQLENISNEDVRQVSKRHTFLTRHKNKLFLTIPGRSPVTVIGITAINSDLKIFCKDFDIRGENNQPYPLHTHQFRRTYARFIARSELGDLLTLCEHFGHWSLDMTTYYADGGADEYESDIELMAMVTQEKQTRQSEIMTGLLDSEAPLAKGGEWLKAWRSSVRTAENKEKLIAEYSGSITLNGTGHSWCVGNARGTGCGGLCIFEAQMCVDCHYGIIGPEHRPVWEGIRDQQKEALALDDMGESGRARAQLILDKAETVLRRLEASKDQ
ncbi:tyrosine-type recombinase/integrase [Acidithiobacillus albertensis]|uniref:tyrosine-type recombinase/integrase n=1 Tax=Acidithiobacillus albertensis TaxID=119978 RepID=UPI00094B6828|nr:tyrosine-type recombinase/integrase [Acidithiobacillus albertensis]